MILILLVVLAVLAVLAVVFGVRNKSRLGLILGIAALVTEGLGTAFELAWNSGSSSGTVIAAIPLVLIGGALVAGIVGLVFAIRARPRPALADPAAVDHAARVEEIK